MEKQAGVEKAPSLWKKLRESKTVNSKITKAIGKAIGGALVGGYAANLVDYTNATDDDPTVGSNWGYGAPWAAIVNNRSKKDAYIGLKEQTLAALHTAADDSEKARLKSLLETYEAKASDHAARAGIGMISALGGGLTGAFSQFAGGLKTLGIGMSGTALADAGILAAKTYGASAKSAEERARAEAERQEKSHSLLREIGELRIDAVKKQIALTEQQAASDRLKTILGVAGGALALGGAGYALYKWLGDREEERASRTRMKMRIDTPDGKDAIVDLPISNPQLSGKLAEEFNKGVTRTVKRTARHNSVKRDPETGKLIPYPDFIEKYPDGIGSTGEEYTQKAAKLQGMPADNLVDNFAQDSDRLLPEHQRSTMVRRFLDSFDMPKQAGATTSDPRTAQVMTELQRTGLMQTINDDKQMEEAIKRKYLEMFGADDTPRLNIQRNVPKAPEMPLQPQDIQKLAGKYYSKEPLTLLVVNELKDEGKMSELTAEEFNNEVRKRYAKKHGKDKAQIQKLAAGRDTQRSSLGETLGGVTAPALAGIGAGFLANRKFGADLPTSLAVGGATALATPLLGMTAAALSPNRTVQEQAQHDLGFNGLLNALVPGLAQFNLVQRAKMINTPIKNITQTNNELTAITGDGYEDKPQVKNKNLESSELDMDDDDF